MTEIRDQALSILRSSLEKKNAEFHQHQWESISTLVEERGRLLVVQRTGWGKSAVYFIATRLMREDGYGPTIIISPLLALMRNQIASALGYGIQLGTINSSQTDDENRQAAARLLNDQLDAIIISPEQLSKPAFVEEVLRPISDSIGMFVIDEAHCISDWGHDFRPDYKRINNVLGFLPVNLPVLATTATANMRVINDVASQLGGHPAIFRGRLTRESIHLQTIAYNKRSQRLAWLADVLPTIDGTGIIYTATTRDAELVAAWLKHCGISAEAYYGTLKGMATQESQARRLELEDDLLNNRLKALVATSALGMGYDKPDLAFVIHFQSPGSVVGYYQQVGRAGRGISKAHGVLLSGDEDDAIQQYFIDNAFPKEELVAEILQQLEDAGDGLKPAEIERLVNGRPKKIEAALKFLGAESPPPVVVSDWQPVRYSRTITDYELPHDTIQRLSDIKRQEWQSMQAYVAHDGCLMQFLANELDEDDAQACGKCANCTPEEKLPTGYRHETGLAAVEFLENQFIEILPKKRGASSHAEAAARFPEYGLPFNFGDLAHEPGRALCRWGEAGWSEVAMHGKRHGAFDERLVAASASLIRERWQPDLAPVWVAYVPSPRHPQLVPDFARRLAAQLGLPCVDAVSVAGASEPQKGMENTFHRCRNLDGAFVIGEVYSGPVLLLDDAVDSGWTLAVVAALLRREGAGPVFPFAIMSTATST